MGVYAGDTVPYLTETFNVAPDVQRYIGNALVRDNDDVKPTLDLDFANNKSLTDDVSGDNLITFTRTTVGTYVDSEGIIRTSGGNICTFSEDFTGTDWAWQGTTGTITSGFSSPAGDLTASKLITPDSSTSRRKDLAPNGVSGVTNSAVSFNLLNGEYISTIVGSPTYGSESVSNGWYRYWITASGYTYSIYAKSAEYTQIQLQAFQQFFYVNVPQSVSGNTTDGILIWGAQVEEGPTASQYLKTTTAPNYFPRYDHDPVTLESLGLLIEESRTNLVTYSENFNLWGAAYRTTISLNAATSPSGGLNAAKFNVTTDTGYHARSLIIAGGTYTVSIFAKAGEYDGIQITGTNTVEDHACFNLVDGTAYHSGTNVTNIKIENYGNGWYRCSARLPLTNGSLFVAITDGTTTSWLPSFAGSSATDGIYIWGAQVEAGSFPTSYIPTSGSTVTRGVDSATITGTNFSSWYNASEGTILAEYYADTPVSESPFSFAKTGAELTDVIAIGTSSDGPTIGVFPTIVVTDGGTQQTGITVPIRPTTGDLVKTAVGYKQNDIALYSATETESGSSFDSTGTIPTVDFALIGKYPYFGIWQNRPISRLTYYPTRLPDTTLQELTQDNPTNLPATITPSIVTDGLVLNLDAGTPSSYSGTGTTWFDKTDNNNDVTLVNGPTFSTDGTGSIVFPGTNEYGTLGNTFTNGIRDITVSAWIYLTDDTQRSFFITKYNGLGDSGWILFYRNPANGNAFSFDGRTSSGVYSSVRSITQPSLNKWYHVVGIRQSDNWKIYVDGDFENSVIVGSPTNVFNSTGQVEIGRVTSIPSEYATTKIANIKVYDRALSASEVKQNYQALLPRFAVTDGLVLNLDAGNRKSYPATGTTWTDLSGNGNDGTLTNGPTFDSSNGGSIVFDGVNDYAISNINLNLLPEVSFSAWIYTTRSSSNCGIMGNDNGSYGRVIRCSGAAFQILNTNGIAGLSTSSIPLNQWFNIVVTWSTSSVKFYLNSTQEQKTFAGESAVYNDATSTYFGSTGGGAIQTLLGNMAQVKIYNRALSASEVEQNFNVTRGRFGI